MADNQGKPPFDPHSAPTVMEMSPVFKADPTPAPAPAGEEDAFAGTISLLKRAFELYKQNFVMFLITAAVALGPVFLLQNSIATLAFAPAAVVTTGLEANDQRLQAMSAELERKLKAGASPEEVAELQSQILDLSMKQLQGATVAAGGAMAGVFAGLLGLLLTIPLSLLATFLAQGALVVAVSDRLRGGNLTWQGAWRVVGSRLAPLVITSLLASLAVLIGTMLCVLPGLAAGFLFSLAAPVVLLERRAGVEALKRSFELVKGDWLRVLLVAIAFGVLSWAAALIGGLFVPDRFVFVDQLMGDLVSLVLLPVPIIGLVLVYDGIVRRREGQAAADERQASLLA